MLLRGADHEDEDPDLLLRAAHRLARLPARLAALPHPELERSLARHRHPGKETHPGALLGVKRAQFHPSLGQLVARLRPSLVQDPPTPRVVLPVAASTSATADFSPSQSPRASPGRFFSTPEPRSRLLQAFSRLSQHKILHPRSFPIPFFATHFYGPAGRGRERGRPLPGCGVGDAPRGSSLWEIPFSPPQPWARL